MKSLLLITAILAGCGSDDPVDAEGTWTVSTVNREDDCNIGWNVGQTSQNVEVSITQSNGGESVNVDINGIGGGVVDLFLGGNDIFTGHVSGAHLTATREGTRSNNMGNCTYTYNATIEAHISGDTMMGSISYRPATNGNSDCAAVECVNVQDFSGNRPPM